MNNNLKSSELCALVKEPQTEKSLPITQDAHGEKVWDPIQKPHYLAEAARQPSVTPSDINESERKQSKGGGRSLGGDAYGNDKNSV